MSFRRGPQSIHDADTGPRRRRPARRMALSAVAGGVAVAVAAGVLVWQHDSGPRTDRSPALGAAAEDSLDVFIDGWSAAVVADKGFGYLSGGQVTPLDLKPVTDADVDQLLATTPEIVTNTLARLATVDSSLACSAEGCTSAAGAVDPHWLVDPTQIPGYGPSYAGYGIDAGLYVARVPAQTAELTADGFDPVVVTRDIAVEALPETSPDGSDASSWDPEQQPATDEGDPAAAAGGDHDGGAGGVDAQASSAAEIEPSLANGYDQGRFLMAAGLGRIFQPRPAWLEAPGGDGPDTQRFFTVAGEAPGEAESLDPSSPVTFLDGLAASYPQTSKFGDTQLTYMTSPTTGCGTGVVCVPAEVTPTVVSQQRSAAFACDAEGNRVALAVLDDVHVTVELPAATHQFAVWGDRDPADFDGAGTGTGFFTGQPPLAEGAMDVRWAAVGFFDGDPLALRALTGGTFSGPGADLSTTATLDQALANVRLDGQQLTACA